MEEIFCSDMEKQKEKKNKELLIGSGQRWSLCQSPEAMRRWEAPAGHLSFNSKLRWCPRCICFIARLLVFLSNTVLLVRSHDSQRQPFASKDARACRMVHPFIESLARGCTIEGRCTRKWALQGVQIEHPTVARAA